MPIRKAVIRKVLMSAGMDVKKLGPFRMAGGNVK